MVEYGVTPFTVSLSQDRDGDTLIRIAGELDIATAKDLEATLESVSGPLTLDCRDLTFIDATGLGVFVRASRRHESVVVRALSGTVRRVFEIAGMSEVVSIEG